MYTIGLLSQTNRIVSLELSTNNSPMSRIKIIFCHEVTISTGPVVSLIGSR